MRKFDGGHTLHLANCCAQKPQASRYKPTLSLITSLKGSAFLTVLRSKRYKTLSPTENSLSTQIPTEYILGQSRSPVYAQMKSTYD